MMVHCDDCHGWMHGPCANMDSTEAITLPHFSCSACSLRSVGAYLPPPLPSQLQHKSRATISLSPPISTSLIARNTSPLADPTSHLSLASSSLSSSTAVTLTQPPSLISCSPPGLFLPLPSSPYHLPLLPPPTTTNHALPQFAPSDPLTNPPASSIQSSRHSTFPPSLSLPPPSFTQAPLLPFPHPVPLSPLTPFHSPSLPLPLPPPSPLFNTTASLLHFQHSIEALSSPYTTNPSQATPSPSLPTSQFPILPSSPPSSCSPHPNPSSASPICCSSTQMKNFFFNARSLFPKLDELKLLCLIHHPHLIFVTETWLSSDILNSELSITGYSLYRLDRNRHGGGVAMYISSHLSSSIVSLPPNDLELLLASFVFCNHSISIGTFYHPPSSSLAISNLASVFSNLRSSILSNLILVGDFNIHYSSSSTTPLSLILNLLLILIPSPRSYLTPPITPLLVHHPP